MDWSSQYAGYVMACYALSALVILVLVVYIVAKDRRLAKGSSET